MPFFKYCETNLYYEMSGEGPPLLLINGLGCDTRSWEPLLPHLKGSFNVVTYDMRCAGKSDKPDAVFSIHDLAEEAVSLIGHLGLKKPVVLGLSMGGMVAMDLAINHADLVDRLFLVATGPSLTRPFPQDERVLEMFHRTDVSPELLTAVFETVFGSEYRKKVTAGDYIKFRMEDPTPQPLDAYLRQLAALEPFDIVGRIKDISCPVNIIAGDEDKVINPANARWMHDQLPGSKLHIFNGVGHMVPLEAAEELATILVEGSV